EVPEEEFVASWPALEALVELLDLPDKRFLKTFLVPRDFSLPWIREDRDSRRVQLDELRLGAKVDIVFPPCPCINVKISLKLAPVVTRDEDDRSMVGHVDEPVDPEIPFSDGGLISGQVTVDDEQVGS